MRPASHELGLLRAANLALSRFVADYGGQSHTEARFQALEAVASELGGFDLTEYRKAFPAKPVADREALARIGHRLVALITATTIPPALAVSALAREALSHGERRSSGAYHTDYRLAMHLAEGFRESLRPGSLVLDPACGAGILLTAISVVACGSDKRRSAEWLAESIYACDLSPVALRGTQIALACLTNEVPALVAMRNHWREGDSLLAAKDAWSTVAPQGFDVVVANPPWEKVKLSRHEFLQAEGADRQYGDEYAPFDQRAYESKRFEVATYGAKLARRYASLQHGEPDLYVAFTELLLQLSKPGAEVGLILPAGLIRSKSTGYLRQKVWEDSNRVRVEIFENRARFFEIDTRFKFLVLRLTKKSKGVVSEPIQLLHATTLGASIVLGPAVSMNRSTLKAMRPDLSIPEVRNEAEWSVFSQMVRKGVDLADPSNPWLPEFMREVDMTRDRGAFLNTRTGPEIPVIEGRMVHQHRFGAKSYVSGSGRSAVWALNPPGESRVQPQYWIDPRALPPRVRARIGRERVGFCDITGQTNERSFLASRIPANVVCGNKVPTIIFPNDPSPERSWLWLAIVNSLPFDWAMRRVVTTTVNYFLLLGVPLPGIEPDSLPGRQMIEIAKLLNQVDESGQGWSRAWEMAELRVKADLITLSAFGLRAHDLKLMLEDFPLLDRPQPPLPGENRSTITRDLLLARAFEKEGGASEWLARVEAARKLGAVPYMASQLGLVDAEEEDARRAHG